MPDTLPKIPGYLDPLSLKTFLLRYFRIELILYRRGTTAGIPQWSAGRLVVEATGSYAVLIYVHRAAPFLPHLSQNPCFNTGKRDILKTTLRPPWRLPTDSVTAQCLAHPLWSALATHLGPTGMSFLSTYCLVVVQYDPHGGALQVLGPSTAEIANRYSCRRSCRPTPEAAESLAKRRRLEDLGCQNTTLSAGLLSRQDVPRRALLREPGGRLSASTAVVPMHWLQTCWLRHHPRSCARLFDAVLTHAERRRARKRCRESEEANTVMDASRHVPLYVGVASKVFVPPELVVAVFPYSLLSHPSSPQQSHLHRLLSCIADGSSRLDLRGAVLRHTKRIETYFANVYCPARRRATAAAVATSGVSLLPLMASVEVVAAYFGDLLGQLRWSSGVSFWGVDEATAATNVAALRRILGRWLTAGKQGTFPLYAFTEGVRVGLVPWLQCLYTGKGNRAQRVRRSTHQQRILMQVMFFMCQHVIPFWLRRSFHVTWGAKDPSHFVFVPLAVWHPLVRMERRSLEDPAPAVALQPVTEAAVLASRAAAACISPASSLLYSSVRFMPEARKLRPIAVVRSAHVRALAKMVRGETSASAPIVQLARWLREGPPTGAIDVPPVATGRAPCVAQTPQPGLLLRDALLCLTCGLEERRRVQGMPHPPYNRTHRDEYMELRSFAEATRGRPRTLVRSDAVRCYDSLPQEAVLATVEALVAHKAYQIIDCVAVCCDARHLPPSSLPDTPASGQAASNYQRASRGLWQHRWRVVRPRSDVEKGLLHDIPAGCIVVEVAAAAGASPAHLKFLDGDATRRLLAQHLQQHLVVVGGRLHLQQRGVVQGSAVAMLLCDALLQGVDVGLSEILVQHHEPSLLLRRVDDVLVLTSSPVAGQRALQALLSGWEAAGYVAHPIKSSLHQRGLVQWCGLLLSADTLEVSIEWRRLRPLWATLHATRVARAVDVTSVMARLVSVLWLRTPPTALCGRLNSRHRVAQTVYEMCLLVAGLLVSLVHRALHLYHAAPNSALFAQPLTVCLGRLRQLLGRHAHTLSQAHSYSLVSPHEVPLCFVMALYRTLQSRQRRLRREAGSAPFWRAAVGAVQGLLQRTLRVELQRRVRHTLLTPVTERGVETPAAPYLDPTVAGHPPEMATYLAQSPGYAMARLLADDGPESLTARAIAAVRMHD